MDQSGIGTGQRWALAALRVVIGWHFLYEGWSKLLDPAWTSAGFLAAAQGPAAGAFHALAERGRLVAGIDVAVAWGLAAIGVALIAGLLTRPALVAAAFLLVLFYAANPPLPGMTPLPGEGTYLIVNKVLVEFAAVAALLSFPAGVHAGLDSIVARLVAARRVPAAPAHEVPAAADAPDAPAVAAFRGAGGSAAAGRAKEAG